MRIFLLGTLLGLVVGIFTNASLTKLTGERIITETEAIEHGVAYYHPKNKEFTWKVNCRN